MSAGGKILWWCLGFVPGTAIGAIGIKLYLNKKYRKETEELDDENNNLVRSLKELKAEIDKLKTVDKETKEVIEYAPFPENKDDKKTNRARDWSDDDIYMIDAEEFKGDLSFRDNETITYYQKDGVLVDSADKPIRRQEEVIGKECLGIIGGTREDFLYVSNDIEDKMYEIIVEHNETYYRDTASARLDESEDVE